jgi:hypothetical protein
MSLSQPSDWDEIENTYLLLEENVDTLYQHCLTSDQKKQLNDTHSAACCALWKVGQQARPGESSLSTTASSDLKIADMQLNTRLKNLGDIGAFFVCGGSSSGTSKAIQLSSSTKRPLCRSEGLGSSAARGRLATPVSPGADFESTP